MNDTHNWVYKPFDSVVLGVYELLELLHSAWNMFDSTTTAKAIGGVGIPDVCYTELFQRRYLFYGQCLLTFVVKIYGYVLIGSMILGQIPQIFKVLKRRNGSGINVMSTLLMLEASSSIVAYSVWKQFPINTWGENLVFMVENVILVCLLLQYNRRPLSALLFMLLYTVVMLALLLPLLPTTFLISLNILSMPVLSVSRVMQIYTNYKNHGTGQLSAATAFLSTFQSFGRFTSSLLLTMDKIMIFTFVQASLLNIIITGQIVYYRRKEKKVKRVT
ncbi:mannose-P-dolichol utilization defect 1 protein-like [Saccostrea echinata]|uniref:mannose-P-dolichol utilization defect 1 protein-like n=1 Tax=Saccostrea echinata TaxID=191078 RepID=UPI002A7FDA1A|nr:mannose-P-dolichol utilization defect 1 protein-like [Saccostrea echinata]